MKHYRNYIFERAQEIIPSVEAGKIITNYSNNQNRLLLTERDTGTPLQSFIFRKDQIDDILSQAGVHGIFFKLAYHLYDSGHPGNPHNNARKGYTIIAMGLDYLGYPVLGNNKLANAVINEGDFITKDELGVLVFDYRNGNTVNHTYTVSEEPEELKGFSYPKEEFDELFGVNGISKIELVFGYHEVPTPDHKQTGYTLILFGQDNNGNRMDNNSAGHKIFDFCEPCPHVCPKNVDQL